MELETLGLRIYFPFIVHVCFNQKPGIPSIIRITITVFRGRPSIRIFQVYEKVDDIDLVIGGIAEHNVRGGAVGPTFACIISEQFHRLKYGDRFFYTHSGPLDQARGLSPAVKSSVLQRTLGDVICDNVEVGETQMWVTLQPNEDYNPMEKCRE